MLTSDGFMMLISYNDVQCAISNEKEINRRHNSGQEGTNMEHAT